MSLLNTRKYNPRTQYLICVSFVLISAGLCYLSSSWMGYKVVALVLLMTVSVLASLFEIFPVLLSAVLSALIWNFFFIPPVFTFHIDTAEDMLMFMLYFFIALVNAVLSFKIRKEEKRSRDKEEKEKTIQLYNTLINSLSHELRTPISTILGAVDTLKQNEVRLTEKDSNELLNQIDGAGVRLNRQVENLLNMSRLETGMFELKLDWCDTNEMLYSIIQQVSIDNGGRNIDFTPDESLPFLKYDRGIMSEIVQNLLQNASQYTPMDKSIKVLAAYAEKKLNIIVEDQGPGIPLKNQSGVFEKFYRLPNSKAGGSGLGLSIVKGFVEAHGGEVLLFTNAFGGATFEVIVPAEASYLNQIKNE